MDSAPHWPDELQPPKPENIALSLSTFWHELATLANLLTRREFLLANESTARLRATILEMMLALNGIQRPQGTVHLNGYLGESQLAAIEKTMHLPTLDDDTAWIGQAVSLIVIYRWYAPQLVEKYDLDYPQVLEAQVWQALCNQIPTWPATLNTDK